MILSVNRIISLNSIKKLIFVMEKSCVVFEVRTEFLFRRASTSNWLVVSMHPEGPATGHLDTGFLGFRLSLSKF
jgi:hypothetical protein